MNALDIAIIIFILIFVIRGLTKGFVKEVASLGGFVLAILVGLRFYTPAASLLQEAFGPSRFMSAIGFGILFFATLFIISWIGSLLSKAVSSSGSLSGINRLLGLLFGAVKGGLLVVVCVFLLVHLLGTSHPLVTNSQLAPLALKGAEWGLKKLPKDLSKTLAEKRASISLEKAEYVKPTQ